MTVDIEGSDNLLVQIDDSVATLTINRPTVMNAMTTQMFSDFGLICRQLSVHPDVRVVVITGSGDNFCSGADVSGQVDRTSAGTKTPHLRSMRRISETVIALHELQHPVIAKVRGIAVGAGLNLALGCDIVMASDTARFSQIFARRGLSIDFGGSWLLPRQIGLSRAKELAFLAEIIDAEEADRIGLVSRVIADKDLDNAVNVMAQKIAAGPPLALSMSKKLLNAGSVSSLSQALEAEAQAQTINFATEDVLEAAQSWLEKRPPKFLGR
tara:strand:- start:361 stop:1167 length:807 start_codon:yes stop_codon:yes gene_type:complete